jgi:branched-chain amino acid transport system permease protein
MTADIAMFLLKDGAVTGAIYALLAIASIMTFAVTRVIFIPQGDLISFSALTLAALQAKVVPGTVWVILFAAAACVAMDLLSIVRGKKVRNLVWNLILYAGWPIAASVATWLYVKYGPANVVADIALTLVLIVPFGFLTYRLVFEPLREASILTLLIVAVAVHYGMLGIALYFFGAEGFRLPPYIPGAFQVGPVIFTTQNIIVFAVCVVLVAVLYWLFSRTLIGKSLRATAINRVGARIVGISPRFAGSLAFTLTAFIGALSGILIAPMTIVYYDTGFILGLGGLIGAVLGGMASYPIAAIGSIALGIAGSFASFWASELKDAIVLTLIIPLLVWLSIRSPEEHEEHGE